MPARYVVASFLLFVIWFSACSSGLGDNLPPTTPPATTASSNLPLGIDLGFVPTAAVGEPAVAGLVIPAIGSTPARDIVLLGFSTAAAANNGDGSGTLLSRDTTTDSNAATDVFVAAVSAQDIETRAFSQSLAGKFRHPRCATCHSMQASTSQAFASSAQPHAGPPPGATFPNNDPSTCIACHSSATTFPVAGWQAPAASFDFRTKTVAELAQQAQNVPAGDLEHFVNDRRVLWALDSGILPTFGGRNGIADDDHDGVLEPEDSDGVPRTVPGGSVNFLREITEWIASGRVITTAAAVRDVTLVSRATSTTNAGNGASRGPRLLWVANALFDPTNATTAANTNPVGTVYIVFESDASNLAAGDSNGATDIYRALVDLRVEENATGAATAGGINLVYQNSTVLVSARDALTIAGNGASTKPVIGGASGQFVVFQSVATNLITGFTDGNGGGGADVYVRRVLTNATQLVSHEVGNTATSGNGSSERPALTPTGFAVAFETDATDMVASDTNGARDIYHTRIDSSAPFIKVRSSVTAAGAEGTGGACNAASIFMSGAGRILVAFQSAKTNLAPALTAATNVFLFDSTTGFTTLLNQRIATAGNAIGDGSARAPAITGDGSAVAFESDASNIDVLRTDGNRASDIFLVEVAQLAAGNILPFRISMTATEGADSDGASTGPVVGSFTGSATYPVGFVAYTTAATNLGTSDGSNLMVSFLAETSGVFASFTATPTRGAGPLQVQFTDTSTGTPTAWQWDFDNDGNVDSTVQNPTNTYTTAGSYSVRLVASNANSDGTTTETNLILVVGTIDADFTASVASGVAPLSVTFTDTSTQSPTSWQWDFENDGSIDSTVQNPTHSYTTPGTYSVRLIATNEVGSVTETKTNFIEAFTPVVASFSRTPTSGIAPFVVTFTNLSTGATSFAWDFDEDAVIDSTAANPTFNYTVAGTFDVTLTATGPGGTNAFTFANCVTVNGAVTANFTITVSSNPVTSAYEATNILFTSTSTGTISTHAWDFDFVANPGTLTSSSSSLTRNFASTTTSTRVFAVRLTVSGPGGSSFAQSNLTIVSDTETAALTPNGDSTIYESGTSNSNGAATRMVVGRPIGTFSAGTAAFARRGLVRFSVASIPAGSTINTATLQMTSDTPVATGSRVIGIHRLTSAFTEGSASTVSWGVGAGTADGGATWNNRSFSTSWGAVGGDFVVGSTGTMTVNTPGTHTSTSLVTDVQGWVSSTFSNLGWILIAPEGSAGTVKRFETREGTNQPTLSLNYTRPLP